MGIGSRYRIWVQGVDTGYGYGYGYRQWIKGIGIGYGYRKWIYNKLP